MGWMTALSFLTEAGCHVWTGCGVSPASYPIDRGAVFFWEQTGWIMNLTTHIHLEPSLILPIVNIKN
jgi:hypothetical protein